jgi:hypothetical protein
MRLEFLIKSLMWQIATGAQIVTFFLSQTSLDLYAIGGIKERSIY